MTLTLDEWIAIPLAGETQLGNRIDVTVTRTIAEGKPAAEWLIRLTEELTARLPVAWAAAHLVDEYDALNELPDGTIGGRNIGQSLPGLYWFNVFGDEYIDLLGRARLVTTPAYRVATIGSSIAIQLSRAPQDWKTDDYRSTHKEALRHLGSKYFFDKEHPARSTLAPQWKPPVSSPPKHTAQDPSLARHPPEGMD